MPDGVLECFATGQTPCCGYQQICAMNVLVQACIQLDTGGELFNVALSCMLKRSAHSQTIILLLYLVLNSCFSVIVLYALCLVIELHAFGSDLAIDCLYSSHFVKL